MIKNSEFLQCSVPFVYPRRNRNLVAWSFSIPILATKERRNGTLQYSQQPRRSLAFVDIFAALALDLAWIWTKLLPIFIDTSSCLMIPLDRRKALYFKSMVVTNVHTYSKLSYLKSLFMIWFLTSRNFPNLWSGIHDEKTWTSRQILVVKWLIFKLSI